MYNRIKTIMTFVMLLFAFTANAQLQRRAVSQFTNNVTGVSDEVNETWWGYFDGDYSSTSVTGVNAFDFPLDYGCAIRIEPGNPETLGKRIKALKFGFERINYIEDVKVWMTTTLTKTADEADICCVSVDKSTLKSLEQDNDVNVVTFPEPYQVRNEEIYIGYSFTVISNEGDLCTYPVMVSYSQTMENAFFLNWGAGWRDFAGQNYGNLAMLLLLDDGGESKIGDANYDLNVNVLDVTYTLEYILHGNVSPFNKNGADVDGNNEINIVDVESIIDIILERYQAPTDKKAAIDNDEVIAERNNGVLNVSLDADNAYRGFQMDIILPEDKEIISLTANNSLAATHDVRYSKIADGRYRVIASSINGTELSGNMDNLFYITVDTNDINIENIVFATSALQEKRFNNINMTDVNSIENITMTTDTDDIYNVYGVKINTNEKNLAKGVYIVNGKKVIIK